MSLTVNKNECVELLQSELNEALSKEFDPELFEQNEQARKLWLKHQYDYAKNIGNASELLGFIGLTASCRILENNFRALEEIAPNIATQQLHLFHSWPALLGSYLNQLTSTDGHTQFANEVIDYLSAKEWVYPLNSAESAELLSSLITDIAANNTLPERITPEYLPQQIQPEMLIVEFASDVPEELQHSLLLELPDLVDQFDSHIEAYLLSKNREQLVSAQRVAHNVKGAANIVGVKGIANLMHLVEELLEGNRNAQPQEDLGFLLIEASDCLAAMTDQLSGRSSGPSNSAQVLEHILEVIKSSRAMHRAQKQEKITEEESLRSSQELSRGGKEALSGSEMERSEVRSSVDSASKADSPAVAADGQNHNFASALNSEPKNKLDRVFLNAKGSESAQTALKTSLETNSSADRVAQLIAYNRRTNNLSSIETQASHSAITQPPEQPLEFEAPWLESTESNNDSDGPADLQVQGFDSLLEEVDLNIDIPVLDPNDSEHKSQILSEAGTGSQPPSQGSDQGIEAKLKPLAGFIAEQSQAEEVDAEWDPLFDEAISHSLSGSDIPLLAVKQLAKKGSILDEAPELGHGASVDVRGSAAPSSVAADVPAEAAHEFEKLEQDLEAILEDESLSIGDEGQKDGSELDQSLSVNDADLGELIKLSKDLQSTNTQIFGRLVALTQSLEAALSYQGRVNTLVNQLQTKSQSDGSANTPLRVISSENPTQVGSGLEQYSDFQVQANALQEASADALATLGQALDDLAGVKTLFKSNRELSAQNTKRVQDLRSVPVALYLKRFERCARQTARLKEKSCRLDCIGTELKIDRKLMTKMVDPILQLIRNAIEHGIENDANIRKDLGKPEQGRLRLSFALEADQLVVSCQDDGRGIDYRQISRMAIKQELIPAGSGYTDKELNKVLLSPDFKSSRSEGYSSGFGLAEIAENLADLKGTMSIRSRRGQGTELKLRVPINVVTAHTIVVKIGESQLCLLSNAIDKIIYVEKENFELKNGRRFYRLDQQTSLPLYHIEDLLSMPALPNKHKFTALLIVKNRDNESIGVLVESISANEEQIIKPLCSYSYKLDGLVGSCLIDGENCVPVIDLLKLPELEQTDLGYKAWRERFDKRVKRLRKPSSTDSSKILIVDDSLSIRKSLSQFVGDLGFEVTTAKDGLEAFHKIKQLQPQVVLVDLEMPGLNGFELIAKVQALANFETPKFIMITSKSSESFQARARSLGVQAFLSKPWSETKLSDSLNAIAQAGAQLS